MKREYIFKITPTKKADLVISCSLCGFFYDKHTLLRCSILHIQINQIFLLQ